MAKLQSFRQFTYGDLVAAGETSDGQQCLMLLRCDAGCLRRRFAEMDEFSQRVAKRGERFILCLVKFVWACHFNLIYHESNLGSHHIV